MMERCTIPASTWIIFLTSFKACSRSTSIPLNFSIDLQASWRWRLVGVNESTNCCHEDDFVCRLLSRHDGTYCVTKK